MSRLSIPTPTEATVRRDRSSARPAPRLLRPVQQIVAEQAAVAAAGRPRPTASERRGDASRSASEDSLEPVAHCNRLR
jgi:hypothetical protein